MPYRLVFIVTDPLTAFRLLEGQLRHFREAGHDVTVISAPGEQLDAAAAREGVRGVGIPMQRGLSPAADLPALARLTAELRRLGPDLVVAGTPKAGLLGTLAARLAGVPAVVYHLRGLRFETATGATRRLLLATERVAAAAADRVQCNGQSLLREYVALGCAPGWKCWVPGEGTSNGVDAARFTPTPERLAAAAEERARRGIRPEDPVVGFVGRLARDKGIPELVRAMRRVRERAPRAALLVLGGREPTDPLPEAVAAELETTPFIHCVGHVREPAPFYAMMDLLAFPSHREGFPNAPLEAAAAGLPTVGFQATGTIDAVIDGVTGRLVARGDEAALAGALLGYLLDPGARRAAGEAARARVLRSFDRERLWEALEHDYSLLARRARGEPAAEARRRAAPGAVRAGTALLMPDAAPGELPSAPGAP